MYRYGESLYWVDLRVYPPNIPGGLMKSHIHKPGEYHYIYVLEGNGRIQIDNDSFFLIPGVMYLTAPGVYHSFGDNPTNLVTIELKFMLADSWLREKAITLPPKVEDATGELQQLLKRIQQETESNRLYKRELMDSRLRELILLLLCATQDNPTEEAAAKMEMQPVFRYMRENLHKRITLDDLAKVANLEKSYFSKKFKTVSGYSPMEYFRWIRLTTAKELLQFSDLSVTQVAEAVGFQSIHVFSKSFRRLMGNPPVAYKTGKFMEENKEQINSAPNKTTNAKDTGSKV